MVQPQPPWWMRVKVGSLLVPSALCSALALGERWIGNSWKKTRQFSPVVLIWREQTATERARGEGSCWPSEVWVIHPRMGYFSSHNKLWSRCLLLQRFVYLEKLWLNRRHQSQQTCGLQWLMLLRTWKRKKPVDPELKIHPCLLHKPVALQNPLLK